MSSRATDRQLGKTSVAVALAIGVIVLLIALYFFSFWPLNWIVRSYGVSGEMRELFDIYSRPARAVHRSGLCDWIYLKWWTQ